MDDLPVEALDRNKTALTHRLTALACAYLASRGFKPIETEVPVGQQPKIANSKILSFGEHVKSWIADVASFCFPSPTEAKKLHIKGKDRFGLSGLDFSEIQFRYGPILTAIAEVKISHSDFTNSKAKFYGGIFPAHLCYLIFPKGLLEQKDIPYGWMGLEASEDGLSLRRKYWPFSFAIIHPQHPGDIAEFIASIAIRREHRTRYASYRTMMKMYRAKGTFQE